MARVKRSRLATLKPSLAVLDHRTALPPPKETDQFYGTSAWKALRDRVFAQRGRRCEHCGERSGQMYLDHIVEIKDGGARLDEHNLQVMCASCHTSKSIRERNRRMAAPIGGPTQCY